MIYPLMKVLATTPAEVKGQRLNSNGLTYIDWCGNGCSLTADSADIVWLAWRFAKCYIMLWAPVTDWLQAHDLNTRIK